MGVVCGSGWKLFFPVWNAGLVRGLLLFFQTQGTTKSSGVSVLEKQGLGGESEVFSFLLPIKETSVSE